MNLLKSVTRIDRRIDYVIMYLCNEEDKDNKMYFCYSCFMGFMSKVFIIGQKTSSWCLLGICHLFINVLIRVMYMKCYSCNISHVCLKTLSYKPWRHGSNDAQDQCWNTLQDNLQNIGRHPLQVGLQFVVKSAQWIVKSIHCQVG